MSNLDALYLAVALALAIYIIYRVSAVVAR